MTATKKPKSPKPLYDPKSGDCPWQHAFGGTLDANLKKKGKK